GLPDQQIPVAFRRKITLFFISIRVIHNARNEVRNEEGCGAFNPDCSGTACSWSESRGAAAEENPPDRILTCCLRFLCRGPYRRIPGRSARAWLCGREKHPH